MRFIQAQHGFVGQACGRFLHSEIISMGRPPHTPVSGNLQTDPTMTSVYAAADDEVAERTPRPPLGFDASTRF